jgi:hypothetical protein
MPTAQQLMAAESVSRRTLRKMQTSEPSSASTETRRPAHRLGPNSAALAASGRYASGGYTKAMNSALGCA